MKLTKIYADDCEVCRTLGDKAKSLADDNQFEYEELELIELSNRDTPMRSYIVSYHIDKDGMVDIPIYVITNEQGMIQGSSVVKSLEEVENLIGAWKKWESLQKPS